MVKIDMFLSSKLRQRLGIDDIITVIQRQVKMVWVCFKKLGESLGEKMHGFWCGGVRPRGRPKKTWTGVTEKDCLTQQLPKKMEKVD